MSSGIEIYNNLNEVMFSTDTKPFNMRANGTTTMSLMSVGVNPYYGTVSVPTSYTVPLLAFRKTDNSNFWCYSAIVVGSDRLYQLGANTSANINWYLFDFYNTSASHANFGLEIYDSSGIRVYNSGISPPLVVIGFGTTVSSLDPSRTYAAVLDQMNPGTFSDPTYGMLRTWETLKMSSTAVAVERVYQQTIPGFPPTYIFRTPTITDTNPLRGKALVVDVTNLNPI